MCIHFLYAPIFKPFDSTLPEQYDEAVQLYTHANDGPSQQDNENSTEKSSAALGFVPLEEKFECSLQAYNTSQPSQEQDL